jgi:dihydroxy-acid dehydratase
MPEAPPPRGLERKLIEYGDRDFALFLRRSFARSLGLSGEALAKPAIGIVNTASDLNHCHRLLPELIAAVKRGVWQAGGLPLEFPVISPGEAFCHPTAMLLRNLMAMDVEAMIRAQPLDAVVLVGGCDKTLPALVMGAASAGTPAIALAAGPMLAGRHAGERIGACTDCRRFWARHRRGELDAAEIAEVEARLSPTAGTCGVMGTASTMACALEAMGLMLPGGATAPAVHADRLRIGEETGKAAVRLAASGLEPARFLTAEAFANALRVVLACGGSTNAIIHLTAIAGRAGVRLGYEDLNRLSDVTPVLVDLKPTGEHYMEDFHAAGGMPVLLETLRPLLHLEALTVTGRTLGEVLGPASPPGRPGRSPETRAPAARQPVIRPLAEPLQPRGGIVALRGNLAPDGALLKRAAASPELLNAAGRAVVFRSVADLARRIDDPGLDVHPGDFLVLQNAGPIGGPGMPEAGFLPIPRKLAAAGVKDMVRISDARMSGTAFGTVVLHVSPEAAAGGPLGLVQDGDRIELRADEGRLSLLVGADELARRQAGARAAQSAASGPLRGYDRLYAEHVEQAHLGADFDFLKHESLARG